MSTPSEFVPISQLPDIGGPLTDGALFIITAAGVSYKAPARRLVLPADPLLTWADFQSSLPGSKPLMGGPGISISIGATQVLISASSSGGIVVFNQTVDAALGATENDWNPTGWDAGLAKSRLRVTPASSANLLNGLDSSACVDGQTISLYNDSTTQNLRIPHQAGGSLAANRFSTPGGATFAIVPYQCVYIQLNGANGWRILS